MPSTSPVRGSVAHDLSLRSSLEAGLGRWLALSMGEVMRGTGTVTPMRKVHYPKIVQRLIINGWLSVTTVSGITIPVYRSGSTPPLGHERCHGGSGRTTLGAV
jgi:hypothetical protein